MMHISRFYSSLLIFIINLEMCFSGEYLTLRCNKITLQKCAADLIKAHIQEKILILQHIFVFNLCAFCISSWGCLGWARLLQRSKGRLSICLVLRTRVQSRPGLGKGNNGGRTLAPQSEWLMCSSNLAAQPGGRRASRAGDSKCRRQGRSVAVAPTSFLRCWAAGPQSLPPGRAGSLKILEALPGSVH